MGVVVAVLIICVAAVIICTEFAAIKVSEMNVLKELKDVQKRALDNIEKRERNAFASILADYIANEVNKE